MRTRIAVAAMGLVLAGSAMADSISGLCGTGNAVGCASLIPTDTGNTDPNYTIVDGPVTGSPYVTFYGSPYIPDGPDSNWIAPVNPAAGAVPGGYYTYQTTFTALSSNSSISGGWAADNAGYDIILNGKSLLGGQITGSGLFGYGPPYGFAALTPFTITSGFVAGLNTLDFVVQNGNFGSDQSGPSGLRVDITSAQTFAAPEPTSVSLFSIALLGLLGVIVVRNRS